MLVPVPRCRMLGTVEGCGKCFSRNGRKAVKVRIHSCESEEELALARSETEREYLYSEFENSS